MSDRLRDLEFFEGTDGEAPLLSASGLERKEAMRQLLAAFVAKRRRRRRALKRACAAGIVLASLAALVVAEHWRREGDRPAAVVIVRPAPPIAAEPQTAVGARFRVDVVEQDPGVVERYAVDDDELLAFLERVERPAGLVRVGGRVVVVPHPTRDAAGDD